MNIKKRQKLRQQGVNIKMAIKHAVDRDVKRAFEAAKREFINSCNMKSDQGKFSSWEEIIAYQKLLINGAVIIEY